MEYHRHFDQSNQPSKMKTQLFSLALASVLLAGCQTLEIKSAEEASEPVIKGDQVTFSEKRPQIPSLSVEQVEPCRNATVRLNGRMVWDDDVTVRIFSPFGGRVTHITGEVGQHVAVGDTLAQIASPDFGQAQADARKAESDYVLAERNLNRIRELFEHGAAPQKDLQS